MAKIDGKPPKAAGVVVLNEHQQVLGFQRKGSLGYSLPFGKVEPGEAPKAAAKRETREETGYIVKLEEPGYAALDDKGTPVIAFRGHIVGGKLRAEAPGEGRAAWVDRRLLLTGPFSDFNRRALAAFNLLP